MKKKCSNLVLMLKIRGKSPPDLPPLPELTLLHRSRATLPISILGTTWAAYIQVTRQGSDRDVSLLPPIGAAPPPARHPEPLRASRLQLPGVEGGSAAEQQGERRVHIGPDAPHRLGLPNQEEVLVSALASLVDRPALAPPLRGKEDSKAARQP